MKIKFVLPLFLAALAFLGGCKKAEEAKVLHMYSWADYIAPEVITAFEQEFGCKVQVDTFDSNETMYAKIKAGATGYDVLVPSSYFAEIMWQEGLIMALPKDKLPNLQHIDSWLVTNFATDTQMLYSIPYMVGSTGIGYRADKVGELEPTWAVYDRADFKGYMMMVDDMRETLGAALKFLGYSINSTDPQQIAAARDVVIRWKKNLGQFDSEAYKTGLASGSFTVAQGYSGDMKSVMAETPGVKFFRPKEGFSFFVDDLVIPKTAPHQDLALAFINFLHRPEIAAQNIEWTNYRCPNVAAYEKLPPEVRQDPVIFVSNLDLQRAEIIRNLGEAANRLYTEAWDAVKAAQ